MLHSIRITPDLLVANASEKSVERGEEYYETGMVLAVIRRGDAFLAEVEGSEYGPYRVQVHTKKGRVADATCTCPFEWGGWCKHIVAVMLQLQNEPETVEVRPTLAELLEGVPQARLLALITEVADEHPEVVEWIEEALGIGEARDRQEDW